MVYAQQAGKEAEHLFRISQVIPRSRTSRGVSHQDRQPAPVQSLEDLLVHRIIPQIEWLAKHVCLLS